MPVADPGFEQRCQSTVQPSRDQGDAPTRGCVAATGYRRASQCRRRPCEPQLLSVTRPRGGGGGVAGRAASAAAGPGTRVQGDEAGGDSGDTPSRRPAPPSVELSMPRRPLVGMSGGAADWGWDDRRGGDWLTGG
uniref:Uncharacterized protein n=1 Tax=Oryza sativa subsp. japonica TaxID=39947 RepID=Q6Z0T8_ORYSJ|nr:hypothetical protein [Oryza sativa Japonica Group]BAD05645.1 hypothetical protein [Oryza sativa Japonica Group]